MEISPTAPKELGRLIIVRGGPKHFNARFETICRVVRESETRCYVEVVEACSKYSVYGIHGYKDYKSGEYVNKSDIVVEDASVDLFREFVKLENEQKNWLRDLAVDESFELEPIQKRYADRRRQKFAQFDDEVRILVKAEHK